MLTIKQYDNRKYYAEGKYISLKNLLDYLNNGQRFVVIHQSTGKDITLETLGKVLALVEVQGTALQDRIFDYFETSNVNNLMSDALAKVSNLVNNG